MYYEKDYCRHFMFGIFCKLCSDTSDPTSGSSGSTCTSAPATRSVSRVFWQLVEKRMFWISCNLPVILQ
jgi:hypothetical protein